MIALKYAKYGNGMGLICEICTTDFSLSHNVLNRINMSSTERDVSVDEVIVEVIIVV